MLTCLHVYLRPHVVRHWPTLTIIWHHVTPIWLPYQDAPLQQALGIHFDSWFWKTPPRRLAAAARKIKTAQDGPKTPPRGLAAAARRPNFRLQFWIDFWFILFVNFHYFFFQLRHAQPCRLWFLPRENVGSLETPFSMFYRCWTPIWCKLGSILLPKNPPKFMKMSTPRGSQ